jgi:hypothetical protein
LSSKFSSEARFLSIEKIEVANTHLSSACLWFRRLRGARLLTLGWHVKEGETIWGTIHSILDLYLYAKENKEREAMTML